MNQNSEKSFKRGLADVLAILVGVLWYPLFLLQGPSGNLPDWMFSVGAVLLVQFWTPILLVLLTRKIVK